MATLNVFRPSSCACASSSLSLSCVSTFRFCHQLSYRRHCRGYLPAFPCHSIQACCGNTNRTHTQDKESKITNFILQINKNSANDKKNNAKPTSSQLKRNTTVCANIQINLSIKPTEAVNVGGSPYRDNLTRQTMAALPV